MGYFGGMMRLHLACKMTGACGSLSLSLSSEAGNEVRRCGAFTFVFFAEGMR